MPWSINGTEIFANLQDGFPMNTEAVLDWAEEQDEISEVILADLRQNMPRRDWPDYRTFLTEVQNYTWTMPDGAHEPVWGGVTQAGPELGR
jgi:hypothetical protein